MWLTIFLSVQVVLALIALYLLIKDGSSPTRIWAWILVIVLVPIVGVILYSFFGVNLRKKKLFDLKKEANYQEVEFYVDKFSSEAEELIQQRDDVTTNYIHLIRLLTNINQSILSFNNRVRILHDGPDTFEAIFKACEGAQEYIHLQYYIFIDGELVDRFTKLFAEKTAKGVEVRIIYDAFGSWELSRSSIQKLKDAGVELYPFMPVRFGRLARMNYRNHRKILVVDGKVGFTGGINVDDKYIHGDPHLGHWTDTHLRIEGMAVNFLHFVFLADWLFVSGENHISGAMLKYPEPLGDTPIQIVYSGPDTDYPSILEQYLYIVYSAKRYVYIVNPYLVPDAALSMAIRSAAQSGVEVRIIVPANSESPMIYWTVRSYFGRFLSAGVKIYLYRKGFIHSKVIISDDQVVSIGTANLDIRSFEQNFEVNALIYDPDVTLDMKKQIELFIQDSHLLTLEEYDRRSNLDRVKEKLARLSSPLM